MWLLFLEAGMAFSILIFIVWWTMFYGRDDHGIQEDEDDNKK
jgi:hypothetical protein